MNKSERIQTATAKARSEKIAFQEAALRENDRNRLIYSMLETDYSMYRSGKSTLSSLSAEKWREIALRNICAAVDIMLEQTDFHAQAAWLVYREEEEQKKSGPENFPAQNYKRAIVGIGLFAVCLLLIYCILEGVFFN